MTEERFRTDKIADEGILSKLKAELAFLKTTTTTTPEPEQLVETTEMPKPVEQPTTTATTTTESTTTTTTTTTTSSSSSSSTTTTASTTTEQPMLKGAQSVETSPVILEVTSTVATTAKPVDLVTEAAPKPVDPVAEKELINLDLDNFDMSAEEPEMVKGPEVRSADDDDNAFFRSNCGQLGGSAVLQAFGRAAHLLPGWFCYFTTLDEHLREG